MCFTSGIIIMNPHILTILITIITVAAGVRLSVTQERCGQSIDLSKWKRVDLEYVESDVFSKPGRCVIDITTSNDNDMICIRTVRRKITDNVCSRTVSYHIGGYYYKPAKKYTCKDFHFFQKPICDSDSLASIVFVGSYMFRNATVNVVLFTKQHNQTIVGRLKTPSFRSSRLPRSLSSSVESEYARKLKKKQKVGVIVGLSLLGFFGALFCIVCCYINPCNISDTPAALQTQSRPQPEQRDDRVNQTDDIASTSTHRTQPYDSSQPHNYSEGPPTYDQYIMHEQDYYQIPNQDIDENTVELPPPEYQTKPSAPPPPYPGY